MADFTREYVLFEYDFTGETPAYRYAFPVRRQNYHGGAKSIVVDLERNLAGTAQIVRASWTKRRFAAEILLDENASGTVTYTYNYTLGKDTHLLACLSATDLECKSFEDSAFWEAQPINLVWDPQLEFDGKANYTVQPVQLVEK